jgi:hypothetical protein
MKKLKSRLNVGGGGDAGSYSAQNILSSRLPSSKIEKIKIYVP